MSFSRGFSSGYSAILDGRRLALQEQEAERIRKRDERAAKIEEERLSISKEESKRQEKRLELSEDETFGFYTDSTGARVTKDNAFFENESGEIVQKQGIKFNPGTAQYRSELVSDLKYKNSPEFRAMGKRQTQSDIESQELQNTADRLGLNIRLQTNEGASLLGFWNEFDPIVNDPEGWSKRSDVENDLFEQRIAALAYQHEKIYGNNPLEVMAEKHIPGYQTAADLQGVIQKNPDAATNINLEDYGSGLDSLFALQTKKHIGKKFKSNNVEGTVIGLSLNLKEYDIDAQNNSVILNANYEVEKKDGSVVTVPGVLNDTNREIIRPDLAKSDDVAFSLTDLIDFTAAGGAMLGLMVDPKYAPMFTSAKGAAKKQAMMYPASNYGDFKKIDVDAAKAFNQQSVKISKDFKLGDIEGSYGELFGSSKSNIGLELTIIEDMKNNLPYVNRLLEETDEDGYDGFRIKRDENGDLLPIWKLKTIAMKSQEQIRNEMLDGSTNMFAKNSINKKTFTFDKLDQDLTNQMSMDELEDNLDKIKPGLFGELKSILEEAGIEPTTDEILDYAKELEIGGLI